MKNWVFNNEEINVSESESKELGLSKTFANILFRRGFTKKEEIEKFLNPNLRYLIRPENWDCLISASKLLAQKLIEGKRLLVWGDYDVDGITSASIVIQVLAAHGIEAWYHLPDRSKEGYGLNKEMLHTFHDQGVEILLTVDCGISNVEEVQLAKELGMTVIVSDHHLVPNTFPAADIICNPRISPCPCPELAGVGVAFFLMATLNNILSEHTKRKVDIREMLDLVALGTLADMVSLQGQNRILVKNGLLMITESRRPGIVALKKVSGFDSSSKIGAGQVSFNLAPRINAAGRMANAKLALQLLCSNDIKYAQKYANELDVINIARREEENRIVKQAIEQADEQSTNMGLILFAEDWNQGVVGIVASRMVELYNKPTIILCKDGDNLKGSGRTANNFDLHAAMLELSHLLLSYGGHRQAVGLRIAESNFLDFQEKFEDILQAQFGTDKMLANIHIDSELDFALASNNTFLNELELMQPFGVGNPEPIFASPPLIIRKITIFGPLKNHILLELQDTTTNITLQAKAWRKKSEYPKELEGKKIKIAYSPSIDTNGLNIRLKLHSSYLLEENPL